MSRFRYTKRVEKFKAVQSENIVGIGSLDILPEAVVVRILGFLPVYEHTNTISTVNKRFHQHVWNCLKDCKSCSYEILIRKSDVDFLKKNGNINQYYKNLPDLSKDYSKSCSYDLFKRLLKVGAVRLDECANILVEHLIRKSEKVQNYKYVEKIGRNKFIGEYNRSNSILKRMKRNIDLIQCILDHTENRVESKDLFINNTYFQRAISLGNSRLVELYLRNPDKFQVPNIEESVTYISSVYYKKGWKEVLNVIFKYSKTLNITQEIFEKYIFYVKDGYHEVTFLETFLDHYIPVFTNNRKLYSHEKFPQRVFISLRIIYDLIDMKKCTTTKHHHHQGDIIHQVVRFINHFGVTKERKKGVFIKKKRIDRERERKVLNELMKKMKIADDEDFRNNKVSKKSKQKKERKRYFSPREEEEGGGEGGGGGGGGFDGTPLISTVVSSHCHDNIYNDEFDEVQKLDLKRKWRRNRVGMIERKRRSNSNNKNKRKKPTGKRFVFASELSK